MQNKTPFALLSVFMLLYGGLGRLHPVLAADCPTGYACYSGCTAAGQCIDGRLCVSSTRDVRIPPLYDQVVTVQEIKPAGGSCGGGLGRSTLGGINMPWGVTSYNPVNPSASSTIGIVNFASRLLRIFTIICGLWFMFNLIAAGYLYIASGNDSGIFNKFKEMLYYSLLGLLVIALAYLIAGLIGAIFFGDAGFIIRPTLFQATATP